MTLRKGSHGKQVESLQAKLLALGLYDDLVDSAFGPKTKEAVVHFQQAYLVDGIVDTVTASALDAAHRAWDQKEKHLIIPVPHGLIEIEEQFGHIEYEEADGGAILITNDWRRENIVFANLPIVGRHAIHRKIEAPFRAVLQNIKDKGLDGLIEQFGVWCPRHKMHNPARSLSTHSWAISCDINWATNVPGRVGDMDMGIVDSFERFGFEWGGRWRYRDDMHFQLATGF